MKFSRIICAVYSLLVLLANSNLVHAAQQPLEGWLNDTLLPFLEDRLARHPRLKGQPFEVVIAKDNKALGSMDGLTAYIRQKVVDRLQSVPGANLVWRPPIKLWRNRRNLLDLVCEMREKATIQVTIEVDDTFVTGELRIAVQSFDLQENTWVRGFKKVWIGKPTARQKQLLAKRIVDRNQLGSRALPFRSDQPDLMASYLAENLSCLLKQTGETTLKLSLLKPADRLPGFFQTTFQLLGHYLSRFREVEITQQDETANVILTAEVHAIDPKLFQISVLLRSLDKSIRIFGVGTEAYVYLDEITPIRQTPEQKPLISLFQLIAPRAQSHCRHDNPWQQGHINLTGTSRLPNNGCFAVRFKAAKTANLYLLAQTDDGQLTRLFPNSCNLLGLKLSLRGTEIRKHQSIHAPLLDNGKLGYFQLDKQTGSERIYAITVADPKLEAELNQRIRRAADLCVRSQHRSNDDVQRFRAELQALARKSQGNLEWQERSFGHTP